MSQIKENSNQGLPLHSTIVQREREREFTRIAYKLF